MNGTDESSDWSWSCTRVQSIKQNEWHTAKVEDGKSNSTLPSLKQMNGTDESSDWSCTRVNKWVNKRVNKQC